MREIYSPFSECTFSEHATIRRSPKERSDESLGGSLH